MRIISTVTGCFAGLMVPLSAYWAHVAYIQGTYWLAAINILLAGFNGINAETNFRNVRKIRALEAKSKQTNAAD